MVIALLKEEKYPCVVQKKKKKKVEQIKMLCLNVEIKTSFFFPLNFSEENVFLRVD